MSDTTPGPSQSGAGQDAGAAPIRHAIARLMSRCALSRAEARGAMETILSGSATPAQIAGFLIALRLKGETTHEIAGLVEAMRAAAVEVAPPAQGAIDLCGTGGDGSGTINISTAAALVAAAAGAPVAKHGNRSASSRCGSADVLEALGVAIERPPQESARQLAETGFTFLFAPVHHPAMRHAGPARRELGVRTVFNILGPLCNPAGVRRQLIGVFDDDLRSVVADVLRTLGSERVWVVHGQAIVSGESRSLDEISIAGLTRVTELAGDTVREHAFVPEDVGLRSAPLEALRGGDAAQNARMLEAIFAGEKGPRRDAVLVNAAAGLLVGGIAASLEDGIARAAEAIDAGRVTALLEALRAWR